jgi:hypothetical protein
MPGPLSRGVCRTDVVGVCGYHRGCNVARRFFIVASTNAKPTREPLERGPGIEKRFARRARLRIFGTFYGLDFGAPTLCGRFRNVGPARFDENVG